MVERVNDYTLLIKFHKGKEIKRKRKWGVSAVTKCKEVYTAVPLYQHLPQSAYGNSAQLL